MITLELSSEETVIFKLVNVYQEDTDQICSRKGYSLGFYSCSQKNVVAYSGQNLTWGKFCFTTDLTTEELLALAKNAIDYAFAEPSLKKALHQTFESKKINNIH